ncbi:unnamed protein product [Effrenium voratum]|nr:unnamed protein product [Effrenium voratum]
MARYVFLDEARLNSPQPAEVSLPPLQSRLRGWWPWLPTSSDPNPRGDRRWMPDEKCTKCFACGEFFNTWTRRRHHCRLCGQIFCHKCCSNWVKGALVGRPNETRSRLCEACTDFVDDKLIDRSNIGRSALSGETDARNAVPAQDFYGQDQSPTGEDDARSARSNSSSDSSGEDEEEAEDPEVNDYRAEVGLPKESLEHLNEALEGLKDLECRASYDKHGAEWWRRAEAGARRFAGSVKAYCQEVGLDQEHVQVICKLAQQVVERTKLEQDDSMDILEYVKVKKVPVGNIKDSKCLDGVVFSADVVHRKMPSDIDNCPLMLIQMPLTFDKYNVRTDLDALRDQEQIYLDLKERFQLSAIVRSKEIRDPKEAENIELVNMRQWLCEHKTAWHRAIVNLNEFHAEISKRLKKVKDCLGSEDREVMEKADQLLANTLCREILDAFREGASKSSRAKDIYEDLVNLQKLRTVGDKSLSLSLVSRSKNAAVPLQQMMSSLITTATETYNRFWTPERGGGEAELKPRADSGEPLSGAGSWISTLDMTPEEVAKRENELRPQVRGALPIHLDSVIKAFGKAVEESEQTTSEFEKCAHGICLPVSFDDVGSQIAYALISDKARDQMEGQLGCCLDADSDACLRSLPTALRRPSVKVSRDERKPPQERRTRPLAS